MEKATGPAYDPTDFLEWALVNSLPVGLSNTVEPFQDTVQARNCLKVCNQFDIPLFIQTKTLNFDAVSDLLEPIIDNTAFFISMPGMNPHAIKRFEPGTPTLPERLKAIEWLVERGAYVIAALAPYHEEFAFDNPTKLAEDLVRLGVSEVFIDRLHLNARQRAAAADQVMAGMAGGPHKAPPPVYIDHLKAVREVIVDADLHFYCNGFDGVCYGIYNTTPTIVPDEVFSRGNPWVYHDALPFAALQASFYDEEAGITPVNRKPEDGILLTWSDCLAIMEVGGSGPIEQEFSYRSLYDVVPIGRKLTDAWKATVRPTATMPQFFRAIWNHPYETAFIWSHPWIAVAAKPDGFPHTDADGNLVAIFDPDILDRHNKLFRKVESLDSFRRLEVTFTPDPEESA